LANSNKTRRAIASITVGTAIVGAAGSAASSASFTGSVKDFFTRSVKISEEEKSEIIRNSIKEIANKLNTWQTKLSVHYRKAEDKEIENNDIEKFYLDDKGNDNSNNKKKTKKLEKWKESDTEIDKKDLLVKMKRDDDIKKSIYQRDESHTYYKDKKDREDETINDVVTRLLDASTDIEQKKFLLKSLIKNGKVSQEKDSEDDVEFSKSDTFKNMIKDDKKFAKIVHDELKLENMNKDTRDVIRNIIKGKLTGSAVGYIMKRLLSPIFPLYSMPYGGGLVFQMFTEGVFKSLSSLSAEKLIDFFYYPEKMNVGNFLPSFSDIKKFGKKESKETMKKGAEIAASKGIDIVVNAIKSGSDHLLSK